MEYAHLRLALMAGEDIWKQLEPLIKELSVRGEEPRWFQTGEELMEQIRGPESPDVLFLDTGQGGMELARCLRREGCALPIILVAEKVDEALEGYEVDACRCLMKPVKRQCLEEALEHCRSKYASLQLGRFQVLHRVRPESILWFYSKLHRIYVYLEGQPEPLITGGTAVQLERVLPPYFIRCKASAVVNLKAVSSVQRNKLVLYNGTELPVSRYRCKEVLDRYKIYQ